jgi:hypothetical protein
MNLLIVTRDAMIMKWNPDLVVTQFIKVFIIQGVMMRGYMMVHCAIIEG